MKNEGDVKKAVKVVLKAHGWWHYMPAANAYGVAGASDFLCLREGLMLAVETKFGNNKPTPMQLKFLDDIRQHGGMGVVVRETSVSTLNEFLGAIEAARLIIGHMPTWQALTGVYHVRMIPYIQTLME